MLNMKRRGRHVTKPPSSLNSGATPGEKHVEGISLQSAGSPFIPIFPWMLCNIKQNSYFVELDVLQLCIQQTLSMHESYTFIIFY